MSFLNPFAELFESKLHPHARTLRTTFKQKVRDTFFVFFGSFGIKEHKYRRVPGKYHFGILDIITLGIPYLITLIPTWIMKNSKHSFVLITFLAISLTLILPRAIIAGALTLMSLPIVALVSLITNSRSTNLMEVINNYPVQLNYNRDLNSYLAVVSHVDANVFPMKVPVRFVPQKKNEISLTLSEVLKNNDQTLETLDLVTSYVRPKDKMPLGNMYLRFFDTGKDSHHHECLALAMKTNKFGQLTNKADKDMIAALSKLNVGYINYDITHTADGGMLQPYTV